MRSVGLWLMELLIGLVAETDGGMEEANDSIAASNFSSS